LRRTWRVHKRALLALMLPLFAMAALSWAMGPGWAQLLPNPDAQRETQKSAAQRRREANERLQATLNGQPKLAAEAAQTKAQAQPTATKQALMAAPLAVGSTPVGINPLVDIALPNYANSPNIRKFVDGLPGLGPGSANNLGQYIPVANADTITFPGSDYYEIGLVQYREQMHSDLPPVVGASKTDPAATGGTLLRGYVQLNNGTDSNPVSPTYGQNVVAPAPVHYLGPIILSQKNRPVRIKFTNLLPTGAGGDLYLPVDTTVMGAGMGPDGINMYTQNRATLHLHGGLTPWVSDGTPHQWTVPAAEVTPYAKGDSVANVPDMPAPGPGSLTFYWTNEQSARLMFYHDHAYGITRLNVYGGEAAGYLITDQVEENLINTSVLPNLGGLYRYGIPLVIQDKTFVNDGTTPPGPGFPAGYTATQPTSVVDPLWSTWVLGSTGGNLWLPHEYLPNENIYNSTGFNDMGRWDYAPWMIPPMPVQNLVLPSPTVVPEAFMDTAVVNGTAFPYVELPPTAVRFRILNACNDRMLNLQLYKADPAGHTVTDTLGASWGTEVKMVPASPNPAAPTWPTDGRPGGVPDPTTAGPSWYQIGNEGGMLAQVAVVPPQPVDFDYNRRSVTFGGVTSKSLYLPPAVRADVVVDLSSYLPGDTVILYNDAPAPMPLYDTRYDYFSDDPDQTLIGGAPSTPPGFGPNTRTIMQIRIKGTTTGAFNLGALQAALPTAFAVGQDPILVPNSGYDLAYNAAFPDIYANAIDESLNLSGTTQSVALVKAVLPGQGYTTPPTVSFYGGGGTGAQATATLNGITGITVVTGGSLYSANPTVTITPAVGDTGTGATATATVSAGVITAIAVINPGSNYLLAPTVTITDATGTGATATATITLGSVGAINLTAFGSGYTKAPYVYLTGGGGTGAQADAMLAGATAMDGKNLLEGFDMMFGRMNAVLGSTPNPLTPTVGAGPVVGAAFYIDPPTEVLAADQPKPLLWRLAHIGVDSHAIHFHLFNAQVVNRVDWTGVIKPPDPSELGWKETVRTNPFEDLIVALRPSALDMKLPFGLPESNRLLDVTMPAGSTANFTPVPPPPGLPAAGQITNVMTNFGWEYVWHCHLLGHEENDMMRPIVFQVPSTAPSAPSGLAAANPGNGVQLTWTDPTPFNYVTGLPVSTLGNSANEVGFQVQRATGTGGGTFTQIGTAPANSTTYTDGTVTNGRTYRYRVVIFNAAGTATSGTVSITAQIMSPPTNLRAAVQTGPQVLLTWTDNSNIETGFVVERSTNGGAFAQIAAPGPRGGTGTVTYTDATVVLGNTYAYRVKAMRGTVSSAYTNTATISVSTPAAPTNLAGSLAGRRVTLTWTDNSNNETGFTVQQANNSAFTGATSTNVAANTPTWRSGNLARRTTYWFQVRSYNGLGTSAWSNVFSITTP